MGKRKTHVVRTGPKAATTEVNRADSKIKAIKTWDDIEHDAEDDFHDTREKILLGSDEEQAEGSKQSDREVFGLEGVDSDDQLSEDEIIGGEEEEEIEGKYNNKTWGVSKSAYYNADEVDDIDEMREEEEEGLRIQKEQLAHLDEEDFVDGLSGWGVGNNEDVEEDKRLVESVSKELEDISFDKSKAEKRRQNLPVSEKLKIIQNESPELIDLLDEFKDTLSMTDILKTVIDKIQKNGQENEGTAQFLIFKYQTLMNYMTNISFYFALKASNSTDIKDHPVIQALFKLRSTLEKLDQVEETIQTDIEKFVNTLDKKNKRIPKLPTVKKAKDVVLQSEEEQSEEESSEEQSEEQSEEESEEESEDDIQNIEEEFKSLKKAVQKDKKRKRAISDDFGELDALDELDLEDKLIKKKSIRDYVAKIDTKQSKVNKYQGDTDIPYRDRVKNERKGVAQPKDTSADLDENDLDEDDAAIVQEMNQGDMDEDEQYYMEIAEGKSANKKAKKEDYEASRTPIENRDIHIDEGQKRLASYKILKNKGLTRHRKKENRNSRVKHKNKYEKMMKKLPSTRAVYKAPTSNYGGEMSGVKTNVVKSLKLAQ
ncbi:Sas10 C-terminal domain-containing protein [Pilobolus umbonatus]|nr:Sas10 C-terminal domain-containing protein [Pilobolus umbonatus]